jgi:hypothetical protein
MALIVDELDKKIEQEKRLAIEELTKVITIAESAVVREVDGRTFGCWGWSVRIYRTPKSQPLPKTEETPKSDDTSVTRNVPVSV